MAIEDLEGIAQGEATAELAPVDGADVTTQEAAPANALATASPQQAAPDQEQAEKLMRWADPRRTLNIAAELDADLLGKIGQRVKSDYELDVTSRSEWLEQTKAALDLAMQVAEEKSYPWPKSSNVIYPLMTTAAIQFAARAYPAIVSGRNVVKGVVVGKDDGVPAIDPQTGQQAIGMGPNGPEPAFKVPPGEKRRRADRIGEHMSYQLLEEQSEWEEQTDTLLHVLPIVGCAFRKTYFDPQCARNMSLLVTAQNVVINYWAKSMDLAPRISEELKLYPIEIEEAKRAEIFIDQDYVQSSGENSADEDAPIEFIEQHRSWDLDDDGYPEPYIITIHKDSGKVARIVARFDPEGVKFSARTHKVVKIEPVQYYTKYDFLPNVEGGIYGMGFGQLLKPINESVNTTLNMLIDAGHLANVGGGFIGRGLSMHSGSVRFKMGEYKVVNAPGGKIRDSIVQMQFPGPSTVLFSLLGMMIDAGKDIASVKDVLTGDSKAMTMQPTTLLALVEQGLKVFTGIFKRVHRSAGREYAKLYRLNRLYLDEIAQYRKGDEWKEIKRDDYDKGSGVEPISDPSMVSDMQRMARAQFLASYQNDPLCNPIEIRQRVFDAAGVPEIDKVLAKQVPKPQPDPALLIKGMELELKAITGKAKAISDMSVAVKNLAEADATVGQMHMEWINAQLEVLRTRIEALDDGQPADGSATSTGGQGDQGTGLPALAPPSGDEMVSPVSPGLPEGLAGGSPGSMAVG